MTDRRRRNAAIGLGAALLAIALAAALIGPGGGGSRRQAAQGESGVEAPSRGEPAAGEALPVWQDSGRPVSDADQVVLAITTMDVGGGPVAGAVIATEAGAIGETGRDGTLEIRGAASGLVPPTGTIVAMAPDYATQRIAYVLPAALTLRLIPGSVVAGTVVRADTGEPVEGIAVRVGDEATISDEEGRFTVRGLAPGIHKVMARGKGWFGALNDELALGLGRVELDIRLPVQRAFRVIGRVTVDGRPMAGGEVRLAPANPARIDDRGSFVVESVPPGRHELSIASGDSSSFLHVQSSREVAVVDRDVILEVALGERHAVAVEVVDNGGRPVSGVAVHGTFSAGEWEHSLACVTDASGRCRFTGLPRGNLTEVTPGFGVPPREIPVPAPATQAIRFILPPRGEIRGEITTRSGMPPPPRVVALDSADDDPAGGNGVLLRVHTDPGGRFRFPLVPAGRYLLEVRSSIVTPGGPVASSLAEPPEHTQHVQVTAGEITVLKIPADEENGRIEGVVEEADGRPARDVLVTYDAAIAETGCPARLPGGPGLTVTGDDGRFVLSSVPLVRRHRVIAFRSTGDCATRSISAAVGQMVRLRLQPLGHLRLSISGLTGDETAEVTISDERVRLDTALVRARRSWFLFSTLPAGRRLIAKARARSGQAETVVVLAPGRTSMVELTLSGS